MQVKETRVGEFTSLREFLCCFIAIHKVSPFIGRAMSSKATNNAIKPWRILSHKSSFDNTLIWVVYCHVEGRLYCHGKDPWRKKEDKKVTAQNLDWYIKHSILPLPIMQWELAQKNLLYPPGQVDEMTGRNPNRHVYSASLPFLFLFFEWCKLWNRKYLCVTQTWFNKY